MRINGRGASGFCPQPTAICHCAGALSREFRVGLPMELLYSVDLVLIAETKLLLPKKLRK